VGGGSQPKPVSKQAGSCIVNGLSQQLPHA
jgi:hypothetical protein